MTKVIVDPLTCAKLMNVQVPLELCDESGHLLGRFIPALDQSTQGNWTRGSAKRNSIVANAKRPDDLLLQFLPTLERRA